jgi:hypothetical protein
MRISHDVTLTNMSTSCIWIYIFWYQCNYEVQGSLKMALSKVETCLRGKATKNVDFLFLKLSALYMFFAWCLLYSNRTHSGAVCHGFVSFRSPRSHWPICLCELVYVTVAWRHWVVSGRRASAFGYPRTVPASNGDLRIANHDRCL